MNADPELTHHAVMALWPQLEEIVGAAAWPTVASQLEQLTAKWTNAQTKADRMLLAAKYRDVLAPYPRAYYRLLAARGDEWLAPLLLADAAEVAERLGDVDGAEKLRRKLADPDWQRLIFEKGIGQAATSVKLSNIDFNFWNLAAALGGVLSAIETLTDDGVRPIGIAGAVLTLISSFGHMLARKIEVDDASVFLGLVDVAGESREASLAAIIEQTNVRRTNVNLAAMTEEAVNRSLTVLHQLRSVEPTGQPDVWRVVEYYGRV
jgi:hypothetical protein